MYAYTQNHQVQHAIGCNQNMINICRPAVIDFGLQKVMMAF